MKKFLRRLAVIIILATALLGGMVPVAQAQSEAGGGKGIFANLSKDCFEKGTCNLCDILGTFINISNTILRFFAVLAVIFFIYGAGYLMISSGNDQMVTKGKGIIKATIVGTIIVLISWQLMAFVVMVLANQNIFEKEKKSNNPVSAWYDVADRCGAKK